MPTVDSAFVFSYEKSMRAITENEYVRRLAAKDIWWDKVSRTRQMDSKTERIAWFLSTAMIEPVGPAGTGAMSFQDMVVQMAEYPTFRHATGLTLQRDQLEFLDGNGLSQAAEWSAQVGNEIAYLPQRLMAQMILNGANTDGSANAYDGVPFFTDLTNPHPVNPFSPSNGSYANWLHGSASGSYPGALPIDSSVTPDVALKNLGKAIAYVSTLRMPNGVDPRFLTPAFIVAPPAMAPQLREITGAKYLAQSSAGGGGGSADVEALITGWGLGTPIIAQEFGAATNYTAKFPFVQASTGNTSYFSETVTGSDTTYYLVCQENNTTQLGGLLYLTSSPFKVNYYTGDSGGSGQDAILNRANEFQYQVQGRSAAGFGHPYTWFRIDAS